MAVTRDLLNKVLIGLRKPPIDSGTTVVTSGYHKLLLQSINNAKEEAEEAWDWQVLRSTVTVTGIASTATYTLLAANDADKDVSDESRLLYTRPYPYHNETSIYYDGSLPQVFDVTDAAELRLQEVTPEEMERLHFTDNNETVATPHKFTIYRDTDNTFFKVWPLPTGIRTWKMRFVIPQAELADTDITTTLSLPARPVWMRALLYQNAERGEELGAPNSTLGESADEALANAISRERTDADDTGYPE